MSKFTSEDIGRALEIDLLTYLQTREPEELVPLCGNVFCTKIHDSLKISNGMWMWWSRGFGGKSALSYLVKVKDYSFNDAVAELLDLRYSPQCVVPSAAPKKEKDKEFVLPDKAPNNNRAIGYLKRRGIAENIIRHCISNGSIYESLPMHNVVFVGFDEKNVPRYAGMRGTTERRYFGEASGSNKEYTFRLVSENADKVHFFESAIDLLSYATLLQMYGADLREHTLIALSGVYKTKDESKPAKLPDTLRSFLEKHPKAKTIYLHLDNDAAGRFAASSIMRHLSDSYTVINKPAPAGKDINEYLCRVLQLPQKSTKEEISMTNETPHYSPQNVGQMHRIAAQKKTEIYIHMSNKNGKAIDCHLAVGTVIFPML